MPASPPVPEVAARRRWRPGPLLTGSALLHLGAIGTVIARPALWPWALGAVLADHALIGGAGLWPRSTLLGPNCTRLPSSAAAAVALTIDDGPDPQVTPRVLAVLAAQRAHATFFCIGERVRQYPDITREIISGGHSVENHSEHHRLSFSLMGPAAMAQEVQRAQESIQGLTGEAPRFFRAPAGLRNPFLEPVLQRLNLRLVSWTRRGFDTVQRDPERVLERLTRPLLGRDILLLHDGHAARTRGGTPVILEVLPRLLETLERRALTPVTLRAALAGAEAR
jgi:peptidoglycan/xylan/chitin deacetylase (PgdA/CDA1 family)